MLDLPAQNMDTASVQQELVMNAGVRENTLAFLLDPNVLIRSEKAVRSYADKVRAQFSDGFQWEDLPAIVKYSIEAVGDVLDISSKRDFVIKVVNAVIDYTDTPFVPDKITDPIFKALAASLVHFTFNLFEGKASFEAPSLWETNASLSGPSREDLKRFAYRVQEVFKDGFQWSDITQIIGLSIDFMQEYTGLNDAQKKAYVVQILNDVIDITDTPYLPDSIFDPLFKHVVPSFVEYMMQLKQMA